MSIFNFRYTESGAGSSIGQSQDADLETYFKGKTPKNSIRVATKIFEDFWGKLCKESIMVGIGNLYQSFTTLRLEPGSIVHYTRPESSHCYCYYEVWRHHQSFWEWIITDGRDTLEENTKLLKSVLLNAEYFQNSVHWQSIKTSLKHMKLYKANLWILSLQFGLIW